MGHITLIGAGPGDAELLTLKAVRVLKAADVVLYDALVSPQVLDFVRADAQKIAVGKKGYGPSCKQSDINTMMVELAREGKHVVRLKGGDPLVFGRAGEEISAARAAGITVDIIPGITTAQGVAASLGISLTHRDHARRLQFVTGHDHKGAMPSDVDWRSLADPSVTSVIYMPKKTLAALCARVQAEGLAADTPAVAVMDATLPTQRVIAGTVADLAQHVAQAQLEGPVVVLFGQVLGDIV